MSLRAGDFVLRRKGEASCRDTDHWDGYREGAVGGEVW